MLRPNLEIWSGAVGEKMYDPGDQVTHAYFPCGPALASFLVILQDGHAVEAGMVGREGVIGGLISEGRAPAYARTEVLCAGFFLRIRTEKLDEARAASKTLRVLLVRYSDCLVAQLLQSIACNATHTIFQRTAKWLIAARERTGTDDFSLTQEQLAMMLGVGRSYLARVKSAFKASGLIETRRGSISIRNAGALKCVSCQCEDAVREHFRVALDGVYPSLSLEQD
ncbi:Crp/Fnr family transcriptional regulator [Methylocystis sp. JAN1]|uniref:Crp/Fnr family transcriptional regulator n=1 Tax=Methylocystis sp. JAN1 TaxID=3397211 RepID=UPI003FA311BC